MLKKFRKSYNKTLLGRIIFYVPRFAYDIFKYNFLSDSAFIKHQFKLSFDRKLDLNCVRTMNEKIQWLKIYDRDSLYTVISDKIKVRDYVKDKIGEKYLIPLLYESVKPENIPFNDLPDKFVIKANHGSGEVIVVRNKTAINKNQIKEQCKKWLKRNYYKIHKEWQYKDIKPKLFIEQYLESENGKEIYDYKFHCFHGKIEGIQVDIDRTTNHRRNIYDRNWQLLPFNWAPSKNGFPLKNGNDIEKPKAFDEMCQIVEKLASLFKYIRIDLYYVRGKIFFGEMTLHPGSGMVHFHPPEWDNKWGELLKL